MAEDPYKVEFHPDAATRFAEMAQEVLIDIRSFPPVQSQQALAPEIRPAFQINSQDIIGAIDVEQTSVNMLGEQTGHYWVSQGLRVGWDGAAFEKIKALAVNFEKAAKGRVSYQFLLKHTIKWLRAKLEATRSDALTDYIADQCSAAIKDHEIWIPVFRTYSTNSFTLGEVEFRVLSESILNQWFSKRSPKGEQPPVMEHETNREMANLQGTIAACVKIKAERERAREIAHAAADEAIGLLRFLSPINSTIMLASYCVPVGKENTQKTLEFLFEDGEIRRETRAWVERGPIEWNIDEARRSLPGVLESLQNLASNRDGTEFRTVLHHALQLYSRHTIALEPPHKIVFVTAAIESMLLKDSNEPIQKNLGERMAFLISDALQGRKDIVKNVDSFYRVRSELFHHGRNVTHDDVLVVDTFLRNVWMSFARLLQSVDLYNTPRDLITALEDKKLGSG